MKPLKEQNTTKESIRYSEDCPICCLLINLQFFPKIRVMSLCSSEHHGQRLWSIPLYTCLSSHVIRKDNWPMFEMSIQFCYIRLLVAFIYKTGGRLIVSSKVDFQAARKCEGRQPHISLNLICENVYRNMQLQNTLTLKTFPSVVLIFGDIWNFE